MPANFPAPFASRFFVQLDGARLDGARQHYLDEGQGEPLVCVHGNPTWSFFFREVLRQFSATRRVIAPDHIGMGLSAKPQNYPYRLATHIDNLERLLAAVAPDGKINLLLHDWGGAIGMGWATRHPDRVGKIILMNTAAFLSPKMPPLIALARTPLLGDLVIRGLNAFVRVANVTTTVKPLPAAVKAGYAAPYDNWQDRIAVARFVQDVPMNARHPSYAALKQIDENLSLLRGRPLLLQWGGRDWCFHEWFYQEWLRRFPDAERDYYPDAGHYLLEDAGEKVLARIAEFLN
ncbi:haloalkane dehalogenase [Planctomycetales bacterium]|nr:haloalkane dehalogenase [Planctomycetales bacterium]GHS99679.1 haloalkane dehalogenase [Planctomycetales bacterium]GHT06656.1 haloalkane dehalogenase [Planctomycetales bacterium]